jgi:tight adherence protein C
VIVDLFVPIVASLLVFGTILFFGYLIMEYRQDSQKRRSLAMVRGYATYNVHEAIAEAEKRDSIVINTILGLGNRLTSAKGRERLVRYSLYAGDTDPGAADKLIIRKVEIMLLGLMLGLVLGMSKGGLMWLLLPALSIFGFFVPDLLVYNVGLKRKEEIARLLPDALDMLNLCVESGLSFQAALQQVATNQTGPVAEEFATVLTETQLGRSRGQALSAMASRCPQEDVQRFVSAMLQVDKLGVPVATVLREQAREMRAKRAREQAQKVPVKILMPLMLCFLPALFIIILGPAVYSIVQVFSAAN